MNAKTEARLKRATKAELTEALLSACQELATQFGDYDMLVGKRYVPAGSLNNQVLKHLTEPDITMEG